MKLTHAYEEMTPEKRPQDPLLDGTGLRFKTLDHGGEYPDTMPQAIKLTDAQGRSCPITQNGKESTAKGLCSIQRTMMTGDVCFRGDCRLSSRILWMMFAWRLGGGCRRHGLQTRSGIVLARV